MFLFDTAFCFRIRTFRPSSSEIGLAPLGEKAQNHADENSMKGKRMKPKKLALTLLALALASCSGASNNSSSESSSKEASSEASSQIVTSSSNESASDSEILLKLASKLYPSATATGDVDTEKALSLPTYFFDETDDIPYVRLDELIVNVFTPFIAEGDEAYEVKGTTVTNLFNRTTLVFDVDKNEISSDDLDLFYMTMAGDNMHSDTLGASQDGTAKLLKDKCSRTKGSSVSYKLDKYSTKLLKNGGNLYLPFDVASLFFLAKFGQTVSFNGSDYYLGGNLNLAMYDQTTMTLNGYGSAYYGGPYSRMATRSEAFAKHSYGVFLFYFENFYGKLDTLSFQSIDAELESKGYKEKMLSTDPAIANASMGEAVNALFSDGGHTSFMGSGAMSGPNFMNDITFLQGVSKFDPRSQKSGADSAILTEKRGIEAGRLASSYTTNIDDYLKKSGSTAVISFDNFALTSSGTLPSKDTIDSDTSSTFGLLYHCFQKIEEDESIENVILDVSLNSGGAAVALGETFGFLTDDDISFTVKNPVTGAVSTEVVQYDTDLDGDFTDKDSYAEKYNLFILTSSFSFSCGNALPTLAKENHWAKIIGQRSGGGDCVVGHGSTAEGTSWNMSSTCSILRNDGTNVDDGAAPDYEIDLERFYDLDYLDSFIKTKVTD